MPARWRDADAAIYSRGMTASLPPLPDEADDPTLQAFYRYWRDRAPPGRLPGRQHIDPLDIPELLPQLILLDVLPQGEALRFRVRLAGGAMVEIIGANPTGRFIDEFVVESRREALNAAYASVVRARAAHYWENQLWTAGRDYIRIRRLALPLARDGATVDMIVACYVRAELPPDLSPPADDANPLG